MSTLKEEYHAQTADNRNSRLLVETNLSMLTHVYHFKKVIHRRWSYFKTRVGAIA